MRRMCVLCSVFLLPWMASASHCQVGTAGSYGSAAAYPYQQYQPAYQAYPIPFVPLYSAGYQPTTPDSLAQLDKLERIAAALEKLAAGQPLAAARAPDLESLRILQQACASCHAAPNPKGNFLMFDGRNFRADSLADLKLMRERMMTRDPSRHMPPGKQLPYDDFLQALEFLQAAEAAQTPAATRANP